MLEFNLADGNALDIPAASISMFESLTAVKNEAYPDAKSFIRYSIGEMDYQALLTDSFDDVIRVLDINVRPGPWLILTNANGNKLGVIAGNILARKGLPSGETELSIALNQNGQIGDFTVSETRDTVKTMMGDLNRPAGLIEIPTA
jgi:hypothetical protein